MNLSNGVLLGKGLFGDYLPTRRVTPLHLQWTRSPICCMACGPRWRPAP